MIVEDHASSLAALSQILRLWGWEVETASTVAEALRRLDPPPVYLILDLMLPDGDGATVLERVRAAGLSTKVIVTTGASDTTRIDRVSQLAPACILTKPINLEQLQAALDSH